MVKGVTMRTFAVYRHDTKYILIDTQAADVLSFSGSPPIFWINTPDDSTEAIMIVFTHKGTEKQLIEKLEAIGISVQTAPLCSNN